jgi:hypothetical protein
MLILMAAYKLHPTEAALYEACEGKRVRIRNNWEV